MKQFITMREFSQMMAANTLHPSITYCIEETGLEYKLMANNQVEMIGRWRT
jgi:hypothetical protein